MGKIDQKRYFLKVSKAHFHLGLEAAALLAYIAEYERKGKPCFASRNRISQDLPISESTVQRTLKKLADQGYVTLSYCGNLRTVSLTKQGIQIDTGGIQIDTTRGSKLIQQGIQIDTLLRYTKINNKDKLLSAKPCIDFNVEESMAKESGELKKDYGTPSLENGWEDRGTYWEKYDAETRTVVRRPKTQTDNAYESYKAS